MPLLARCAEKQETQKNYFPTILYRDIFYGT